MLRFGLMFLFTLLQAIFHSSISLAGAKCEADLLLPSTPKTILQAGPTATLLEQIGPEGVDLTYAGVFYRLELTPPYKIESYRGLITDKDGIELAFHFDFDGLNTAVSPEALFEDYHGGWTEFAAALTPYVKGQKITLKFLGLAYPTPIEPLTRELIFSGAVIKENGPPLPLIIKVQQQNATPERTGQPHWIQSNHAHLTLHR